MTKSLPKNFVRNAIKQAGGQVAVAQAFGIRQSAVWKWAERNSVPAERVIALEGLTGVSRHRLRPDIYPAS